MVCCHHQQPRIELNCSTCHTILQNKSDNPSAGLAPHHNIKVCADPDIQALPCLPNVCRAMRMVLQKKAHMSMLPLMQRQLLTCPTCNQIQTLHKHPGTPSVLSQPLTHASNVLSGQWRIWQQQHGVHRQDIKAYSLPVLTWRETQRSKKAHSPVSIVTTVAVAIAATIAASVATSAIACARCSFS